MFLVFYSSMDFDFVAFLKVVSLCKIINAQRVSERFMWVYIFVLVRTVTDVLLGDVQHANIYHFYMTTTDCYVPRPGGGTSAFYTGLFF